MLVTVNFVVMHTEFWDLWMILGIGFENVSPQILISVYDLKEMFLLKS
jgi:hypothetical protein